ncbi:MAG TPA: hypothetical protein VJN42_03740 [Candidatus Acidoferrum sp.]|nr:hypothetical protein [Candidatus Acidoferrum sp.]
MLTFFTTAKPFREHSRIIQRNALQSWTLLHPEVEVILFGDDEGAAEIARALRLRHEPHVERNQHGTKRLDFLFRRAQEIARHDVLCYINCDILLLPDFCSALHEVSRRHKRFLMVGRRWDTDITSPISFADHDWQTNIRELAKQHGIQQPGHTVDYFAFQRGLYAQVPALVVGRIWWDHWLVWRAAKDGADVVDVSEVVTAVHQNHNYGYHPAGVLGVRNDEQARSNFDLAGGRWHLHTIDDATHILRASGERRNFKGFFAPYWRYFRPRVIPVWFAFLDVTRPLRKLLGLRRGSRAQAASTH